MREARASRKEDAAAADAAMNKKNAEIDAQKKALTKKRMSFLMKQADVFGKFIGADVMRRCVAPLTCVQVEPVLSPAEPPPACVVALSG